MKTDEQDEEQQHITIVRVPNDIEHLAQSAINNNQYECSTSSLPIRSSSGNIEARNVIKKDLFLSCKNNDTDSEKRMANTNSVSDRDGNIFGMVLPSSSKTHTSLESIVEECGEKEMNKSNANLPSSSICSKLTEKPRINRNHLFLSTSTESSSVSSSSSPDISSSSSSSNLSSSASAIVKIDTISHI